jgi:hypothetical protein
MVLRRFPLALLAWACLSWQPSAHAEGRRSDRAGDAYLRQISQTAVTVRIALTDARRRHDSPRARCVSRKLSQVHAELRIAEEHADILAGAKTASGIRRERYVLARAYERSREIASDARRFCGGPTETELRVIPPQRRLAKR